MIHQPGDISVQQIKYSLECCKRRRLMLLELKGHTNSAPLDPLAGLQVLLQRGWEWKGWEGEMEE